ncbi:MAG: FGGY-family carbohydrate kinase [Candidatus Hydrogenedentota bacterium]
MQSMRGKQRSTREPILIGIDIGTTVLKVCAFDGVSGKSAARTSKKLPVKLLADGGREQNVRSLDRALSKAMKEIREHLGSRWEQVAGMGLAAQGGSSIIADRKSGKPLTPMVLWNDGRAYRQAALIEKRTTPEFWREFTLRERMPHGLARLAWLREKSPDLFHDFNIHVGAGEWVFHRLTGVWRQDSGNAIQVGSYNAATKQLDPAALDIIDIELSFFAGLREGHETAPLSVAAAKRFDLPQGVPVAGPYIDQEAGYLSAVGAAQRPVHCSLGTAWVCNYARPDSDAIDSPLQLVLPAVVEDGQLVVLPLGTGNTAWDWALTTFCDANHGKALKKADTVFRKRLIPPDGLLALPHLAQRNPFYPEAFGAGAFFGINTATTKGDLLRAVAAGMVFELANALQEPLANGAADAIVVGGGASKGIYFSRLIAAMFPGRSVRRQVEEDLTVARGTIYAFAPALACASTVAVEYPGEPECQAIRKAA